MSTKAERGTKRTCQNPECGSRFYDLNRDPILCPICQATYEIVASPLAMAAAAPLAETARQNVASATVVAQQLPGEAGAAVLAAAREAFTNGLHLAAGIGGAIVVVLAVLVLTQLRGMAAFEQTAPVEVGPEPAGETLTT